MSTTPIQKLPPAPRPQRKPLVAAGLSLLVPGVGLLYVGAILPALAMMGLFVALPPLLVLLLAAGVLEVGPYLQADSALTTIVRVVAAVVSFVLARRTETKPLPVVPPGVYGLSLIATLGVYLLANRQVQHIVPTAQLSANGFGFREGEYVLARKVGPASVPVPGALALYLFDTHDAGEQNPAAPTKREAFVGRVEGVAQQTFTVEGVDASITVDDYLGEPLGVILSRTDGGYDSARLGVKPSVP